LSGDYKTTEIVFDGILCPEEFIASTAQRGKFEPGFVPI
jgi:hypothetical protein